MVPPGAALPQCCIYLSQGLSRLPSVPPPRDARASLASPLNWTKGTRRRFPELIPLLNTWKNNQQVPPGPLPVKGWMISLAHNLSALAVQSRMGRI